MNLADHVRKMIAMHSRIHELGECIAQAKSRIAYLASYRDDDKFLLSLRKKVVTMTAEKEQLQAEYDTYRIGEK